MTVSTTYHSDTLRPLLLPLATLLLLACWLSFSPWPNEAVEAVWAGIDRVCLWVELGEWV